MSRQAEVCETETGSSAIQLRFYSDVSLPPSVRGVNFVFSVSGRSLYREFLFLTLAAMGKDHVGKTPDRAP